MKAITFPITLEETFMLSPKVKHFVFKVKNNTAFNFQAGQFITIHFKNNNKILRRSYSIANSPTQNNQIEFAAGYVENGPGSELLFNLKSGDTIDVNGPFGRLKLKEPAPKRYILLGTSTGITPYRSMLPSLTERMKKDPHLAVVILQGVQKRENILYQDEFIAFDEQHPRAHYYSCLSQEKSPTNPHEKTGYVQHQLDALDLKPEQDTLYLCGNPGMIDHAFEILKEKGFSTQNIIREKYISS